MHASEILSVLDHCAAKHTFPVMDHGYIYPAASRLSVHRSETDWALVFESFEYSPRLGLPNLAIHSFGSRLMNRSTPYRDAALNQNYLKQHPHDDSVCLDDVLGTEWGDLLIDEWLVANPDCQLPLRGKAVRPPMIDDLHRVGIAPQQDDAVSVVEWCRYLAATERESVLATPDERTRQIPPGMNTLLVLDEWRHPDLSGGERPSGSECFQQLAEVLEPGRPDLYAPTRPPNSHWSNWPKAGTL